MARLSRLCDIVSTSLETRGCVLSGVSEKQLLLSLSSVYQEIQKLYELQDLEDGTPVIPCNCIVQAEKGLEGQNRCLANIVFSLVNFFEHDSQFVQHLNANILFMISTALIEIEGLWVKFLLFLWIVLENTMSSICGCASAFFLPQNTPLLMEITKQEIPALGLGFSEIKSFVSVLQSTHVNLTYRTVYCLFKVLYQMMKYFKMKTNQGELEENFILLSVKFLQSLPWEFYGKIDFGSSKLKDVLSGGILQFVCSLIQTTDFEDSQNISMEVANLYLELRDLVPKFLSCFFFLSDGSDKCLGHYTRHKTLMLMIRLSFLHEMDITHIISWLRSLKLYFPDLVHKPFSNYVVSPDCCLEESPFFLSCSDKLVWHNPQTWHLQRQALLLFFKCCFRLIQASNGIEEEQCFCGKNSSLPDCSTHCSYCCCDIGLSEISDWLKLVFVSQVDTVKSPMDFGLSFLQLFMDEDDMLFRMLLLFLDASKVAILIEHKQACYDELHLLSSITNPVCLFHMLLFSLKYDHMVVVDYLISKDTGVLCARYLLRSLRFVSQLWTSFTELSVPEIKVTDASNKRRKLSNEDGDVTRSKAFVDAKECLVSLKNTLEDLDRKNLFPYNPNALLKRNDAWYGSWKLTTRKLEISLIMKG